MAETTVPGQKAVGGRDGGADGKAATGPTETKQQGKPAGKPAVADILLKDEPQPELITSRRRVVTASILGILSVNFLMFLRFFFPRTLFEPSTVFKVGYPSDFGFGVDTKFQQAHRIWVVRNAEGIFVIYAKCTHLGCTPDWKPAEHKFKCPCHGSGYDSEGINFEGPAPRPMDRAHVELDAEGEIVVDTSRLYQWPKGEKSHFNDPGAILHV
ncbi:MAG TPA: Rieske 2Fe-2S domain-containing protein [Bryobacterales bacterium]|nr:Rieske 2Fe-2S domain-containing protein [Bryobacterales bacterium]